MNNREMACRHQTLAIRKARTKSASVRPRQINPAGVSTRPPACKEALLAAIAGAGGSLISASYHRTTRSKQQRPRIPEAFVAASSGCLLQGGVDRAELGVQRAADAVDHGDDRQRNAGR